MVYILSESKKISQYLEKTWEQAFSKNKLTLREAKL